MQKPLAHAILKLLVLVSAHESNLVAEKKKKNFFTDFAYFSSKFYNSNNYRWNINVHLPFQKTAKLFLKQLNGHLLIK